MFTISCCLQVFKSKVKILLFVRSLKYYNKIVTLIVLHVASKLCQLTYTQDYPVLHIKIKKQNNSSDKWPANYSTQHLDF
jgi:catechol-2,3-dioxygenase